MKIYTFFISQDNWKTLIISLVKNTGKIIADIKWILTICYTSKKMLNFFITGWLSSILSFDLKLNAITCENACEYSLSFYLQLASLTVNNDFT